MTKPKPADELIRLNRRVGEVCRHLVGCPVCFRSMGDPGDEPETMVRIVAFRAHAIRFECPRCGVRFSVDRTTFAAACDGRSRGLMSDHGWRQNTAQHIWHRNY